METITHTKNAHRLAGLAVSRKITYKLAGLAVSKNNVQNYGTLVVGETQRQNVGLAARLPRLTSIQAGVML